MIFKLGISIKILALFFSISLTFKSFSQIKAITENGKEVLLFNNGTWQLLDKSEGKSTNVTLRSVTRSKGATFELKGDAPKFKLWIDPTLWSIKKGKGEPDDYTFSYKKGDAYLYAIGEEAEIPLTLLKEAALVNARNAAPNVEITKEENITVNGVSVLSLHLEGTVSGLEVIYHGYYYSNANGTFQLVGFTTKALFPKYKTAIEVFLTGFAGFE